MITRSIIDEINEKTDIVALVSEYVQLHKKGKNYSGLCPFHEDTNPSFYVSPEKNICKCFTCNTGGGPIKFYQEINHVSFDDAVRALAKTLGIKLEKQEKSKQLEEHKILKDVSEFYNYYLNNSNKGKEMLEYLYKRGITDKDIKEFEIGYAPETKDGAYKLLISKGYKEEAIESAGIINKVNDKYLDFFTNRIMFKITDEFNNVIGFSGRSLTERAKYVNSLDSIVFKKTRSLYNLANAIPFIKKEQKVVIYEGFFDVISSSKAGIKNVVATMGTALTNDQVDLISKVTKHVILAYDGDEAGINATLAAIKLLKGKNIKIDILPLKDLDPDEFIKKNGDDKFKQLFNLLEDSYFYQYNYFKSVLNLNNMNDVSLFKSYVKEMLIGSPKQITEIYLNKLATDLGVSVYSLGTVATKPKIVENKVIQSKYEIPTAFVKAELLLFIAMLKDIKNAKRIDQVLGLEYVCNKNILKLRTILMFKYYSKHNVFDKNIFLEILANETGKEELIEEFLKVTNAIEYTGNFTHDEKSISGNIEKLKELHLEKEYQQILKEVKDEDESFQKANWVEKQKTVKLKKMKK